jgi:ferric-dicitrate binding protein FerR (iron transport regulator)
LGTAFNIKAYPGQKNVIVSVTRGKVKVEDSTRLLAVLIPDQQINYNLVNAKAEQYKVNANMVVTDWTKQDMLFDEISFASVVEILKKRYDVNIRFSKDALAKCLVRASFDGTERLEKVLTVLCKVLGDSYSIDGHTIVIEGEGCEDAAL